MVKTSNPVSRTRTLRKREKAHDLGLLFLFLLAFLHNPVYTNVCNMSQLLRMNHRCESKNANDKMPMK